MGAGSAPAPGAGGVSGSASGPSAARAGAYPATVSATSQGGPPERPSSTPCGTASLAVASPTATPAGTAQSQVLHLCNGGNVAYDLLYPQGGGLAMTRVASPACGGSSFVLDPDRPLELVPAQLAAGAAWGPVAFTAPSAGASGSVSGKVVRQAEDSVGGTAVPVWVVDMVITLDRATVCGVQISGRIEQTGDWAAGLLLFVQTSSSDTFHTPLGTVTTTSQTRLLSTTPQ